MKTIFKYTKEIIAIRQFFQDTYNKKQENFSL